MSQEQVLDVMPVGIPLLSADIRMRLKLNGCGLGRSSYNASLKRACDNGQITKSQRPSPDARFVYTRIR